MLPAALLLLLLSGDFKDFLSEVKRNPPCQSYPGDVVIHRPRVWSEHYGPRLIGERSIHLAPGIAVISGELLEIGPPFGIRRRPVRILAVLHRRTWAIHTVECGSGPGPFEITRLTP